MNREQAITQYNRDKQGDNYYVPKFQPKPLAIAAPTLEYFEELKRHVIYVLNMASKGDKLAFNAVANESEQIKNRLAHMRNRLLSDKVIQENQFSLSMLYDDENAINCLVRDFVERHTQDN